jgi:hypothetical protein
MLNTNPNSNRASTTNLSVPQALNSQDYEHVMRRLLLNKNKRRQTGRKEEELSGGHEEGAGEMDSDMSEARRHAAAGFGKRNEKARFHSLLSVVDVDGVREKELEQDSDREEWEWEEWEEGRRKSFFDPRRWALYVYIIINVEKLTWMVDDAVSMIWKRLKEFKC